MGFRWGRFLFVKKDINFIYFVVDRVTGFDGVIYIVLFIGIGGYVGTVVGGWVKVCVFRVGRFGNVLGFWRFFIYICFVLFL